MITELLVRDNAEMTVSLSGDAYRLQAEALEGAALIGRVSNAAEQAEAVEAQKALRTLIKECEDARVEVKSPVLDFGRRIDNAAKNYQEPLKFEELRIATLIGDYQTAELARVRSEEAARLAELTKLEKERQAALAAAETHDERDRINTDFDQQAQASAPPLIAKSEGQIIREDWDITVTDLWSLARAHPMCVTIVPRLSEIRELLDLGQKVAGVSAKKVVKSGVRVGSERKAISV